MKKLFLAGCTVLLFACNTTEEFDASLDAKVSKPANGSQPGSSNQPAQNAPALLPNASQPVINNTPVITSATTTAPAQQPTAAGMNPAHGQPGHRCDIAVGAPLNAPATTTTKTNAAPQNVTVTPSNVTQVKTTVAPGMNPAHGEPGHRCDISVGAPLNTPVPKKEEVKKPEIKTDSSSH